MKFKELLEKVLAKYILTHKKVKVLFSERDTKEHSLDSKLKRVNITFNEFKKNIQSALDKVTEFGIYVFNFSKSNYKIVARYSDKELFIFTLLDNSMVAKNFDYNITILEYLKKYFDIDENSFYIMEDTDNDICIENNELWLTKKQIKIIEV